MYGVICTIWVELLEGFYMIKGKMERKWELITLIPSDVGKATTGYVDGSMAVIIPQLPLQIPCDNKVFVRYITLAPMAKVTMSGRFVTQEKVWVLECPCMIWFSS